MTGKTEGAEDALAEFERKVAADIREIEELKRVLAEKQAAFKARHAKVIAALERA
jgi:hypothetical protein